MDDDRVVNRGAIHALKQLLGRGNLVGSIGSERVIGKARIIPGKTMKVSVDHDRRRLRLADPVFQRAECGQRPGSNSKPMSSIQRFHLGAPVGNFIVWIEARNLLKRNHPVLGVWPCRGKAIATLGFCPRRPGFDPLS
jgi:hypothetical protein